MISKTLGPVLYEHLHVREATAVILGDRKEGDTCHLCLKAGKGEFEFPMCSFILSQQLTMSQVEKPSSIKSCKVEQSLLPVCVTMQQEEGILPVLSVSGQ